MPLDNIASNLADLLESYRSKGVIIDSNLLIYYFIGTFNKNLVKTYKRTKEYGLYGYESIFRLVEFFDRVITSPHILTEISNLSNQIEEKYKLRYYDLFFSKISTFEEYYYPIKEINENCEYKKFGLTDSMIIYFSRNLHYLVLTNDLPLYNYLQSQKIDSINFNHLFNYYLNQ